MKKKKCPYCGRRVPYSVAFSRRRKAEYVCKNCGRESRVVINRSVILAFIICAIISIAIFVLWVYLKLTYNPLGILDRLADCRRRMNLSPIGSCALAGTTYETDRRFEAAQLGFDGITMNSIDGVSDRDFCLELMSDLSILMMHLSRFSEEICLWCSWEFRFVTLADQFSTGSSIMPQKKNPDIT
ncbi:MAG: hypothetical protein IIX22_05310, partial [Ruminococcus sp.]|nr:hypothetical protein [Ruminococcus sp.]